jgi:hypothetical protein
MGSLLMIVVTVSWPFSEYHNAGGWPTRGVHPEQLAAYPERVERPDHLAGHRVGAGDIRIRLVRIRDQAGFGTEIKREMQRQAGQRR